MTDASVPERLAVGPVTLARLAPERADLRDWYRFWRDCDPAVFAHLDLDPDQTAGAVADRVAALDAMWDEFESFSYVVRADDAFAGYADLQPDWDRRTAEIGVVLDRPFWGEGVAGDVVATLGRVAFERLDVDLLELGFDADNERAWAAAERYADQFGGRVAGPFRALSTRAGEPVDQYRYAVDGAAFDPPERA
ncbi:GNAT family N-acetyltransferase [Halorarius halobius]|uniref:GNAT family N-acetyltransferase n=1 Tax=Halorarius halobius TaxID=2962671 RepID=UPI0020CE3CD7|nr:GNAT family protein [Halorarius halobius]